MPQKLSISQLSILEKNILHKNYGADTDDMRLSRMESKVFKTQFDEDDAQTRINRLSSAYSANQSMSKYDDNKFTQRMTTALQIGTLILMVLACIL